MTEVEQPPQNGIDLSAPEEDDSNKARPADIEQDMREMERRKRVEAIMGSKVFREELERIVDSARDTGFTGILQQLSDIVGIPATRVGSVFKTSNCMVPINDIRGVESMGYAKGEKILRCKLAATFRLLDLNGWTKGLGAQISARLKVDQEVFLVNPYGLLYHEITASSLNKVDMQGLVVEQGTTNFGVNKIHFILHSIVHAARPDIRCIIYIGCSPVVAISSLKTGLLPITKDACVLGDISTHTYTGLFDEDERDRLVRNLGPNSKVMLLSNHGALCCGETIEEAFYAACHIVQACETQLKLLPVGIDNVVLISDESRKTIYDQSRRPPEDFEKKFATGVSIDGEGTDTEGGNTSIVSAGTGKIKIGATPKWRVGGAEFEALMRMLDNAGFRTGYIYRHPLVKSDPPKPKNDVELPPAVSSLGYLLEEEEMFKQGIWKKGDLRKGGDRSRWLNSPNVYQKVEVLETGTPDPKKITKWVAEGSPTHSTPVRIDDALQFVPAGTNPKEFKRLQQQIKDNRRADKISAGPQSQILEGVTWDEANRIKDATVSSTGDHVVLMGAASKGIIQRGFQHNATVYKAPYAKNPFDNVTDDELNEYKRTVERKKKSIHGEYTDTDFSESEALSSLQTSGAQQTKQTTTTTTAVVSQSEPEDILEHQVIRIETKQAPVPSQPEVVLSDVIPQHNKNCFETSFNFSYPITISGYYEKFMTNRFNTAIETKGKHTEQLITSTQLRKTLENIYFNKKYAFLLEKKNYPKQYFVFNKHFIYMIHKIEIHSDYPITITTRSNNQANDSRRTRIISCTTVETDNKASVAFEQFIKTKGEDDGEETNSIHSGNLTLSSSQGKPPYRTVSHYGFNYPSTYLSSNGAQLPVLIISDVELQRQKVIDFIKSTALNFVENDLHVENAVAVDTCSARKNSNISNESYISTKEIKLEQKSNSKPITNSENYNNLISQEFTSSLSSIGGPWHNIENSDNQLGTTNSIRNSKHEIHNDIQFIDNISSALISSSHHAVSEQNLSRSYVLHNFLPMNIGQRARSYDMDIQHKPESEQAFYELSNKQNKTSKNTQMETSLKRRSFRSITTDLPCISYRDKKSSDCQEVSLTSNTIGGSYNSSDATSLKSIELHIMVSIKNADCIEKLQIHEEEFKSKLAKVIDDEITLISEQLSMQKPSDGTLLDIDNDGDMIAASALRNCFKSDFNKIVTEAEKNNTLDSVRKDYAASLTSLEREFENLLNGIIKANELHNRAIMCDCKTKIINITREIKASLHTT